MTVQPRTPAGSPEGGQFAAAAGLESSTSLPGDASPEETPDPADVVFDAAYNLTVPQARRLADWGPHLDRFTEWDEDGLHVSVLEGQNAAEADPNWDDFYGDVDSTVTFRVGVEATGDWDDPHRAEHVARAAFAAAAIAAASRDIMDHATYAKFTAPFRTVIGPIHLNDVDVRGDTLDAAVFRHIVAGNPVPTRSSDPDASELTDWLVNANSTAGHTPAHHSTTADSGLSLAEDRAAEDAAHTAADLQYDKSTQPGQWQDTHDQVRDLMNAVIRGGYRLEHPAR